jgi:hypothetical protein
MYCHTNSELVHHVIHEHVRQSVPVRRCDIPILRKAEEGVGESMSLIGTTFMSSGQSATEDDIDNTGTFNYIFSYFTFLFRNV